LAVEESEESLECLDEHRTMLLSFHWKNHVIKNQACTTSETGEAGHF